jgi:peptide/nickel transport system ATP-binding protein
MIVLEELQKLYDVRGSSVLGLFGLGGEGRVHAVDSVSLTLEAGSITAIVGESGCGKSTLARMLTLYDPPSGGSYRFEGEDIGRWMRARPREFRRQVQMVFQDPYESLDPRYTIRETCIEPLEIQKLGDGPAAREAMVLEALRFVGLTPAEDYLGRYPHELSGGQRQRVAIARAIVLRPSVIVADEPVSMLDVSLRAGVLDLFLTWRETHGATIVFITHDLAIARHVSDQVAVMYLGEVVEFGPTEEVIGNPKHPYSQALVSAVPIPDPFNRRARTTLSGDVPSAARLPKGCRFAGRCPVVMEACRNTHPAEVSLGGDRKVRCLLYE